MNPQVQKLRQQLDACRPGSDDLSLPELAELARAAETDRAVAAELDRSQRFDQAVRSSLHDEPVPAGLLDRLLAATSSPAPTVALPAPPATRSLLSRRMLISLAAVAAVAIAAVTVVMNLPRRPHVVSAVEMSRSIERWTDDVLPPQHWQDYSKVPAGFAWDPHVTRGPVLQRSYVTPAGESAAVFDCAARGRPRVLLFVVKTSATYPVSRVPTTRLNVSKGMGVIAWQKGNLLYVLAVRENGQRVDDFIHRPHEA